MSKEGIKQRFRAVLEKFIGTKEAKKIAAAEEEKLRKEVLVALEQIGERKGGEVIIEYPDGMYARQSYASSDVLVDDVESVAKSRGIDRHVTVTVTSITKQSVLDAWTHGKISDDDLRALITQTKTVRVTTGFKKDGDE